MKYFYTWGEFWETDTPLMKCIHLVVNTILILGGIILLTICSICLSWVLVHGFIFTCENPFMVLLFTILLIVAAFFKPITKGDCNE